MAQVEVWDILNAGPRHRFTAAGVLVGNCVQDHGGNFVRHGSLNSDRVWEIGQSSYKTTGIRHEAMREKPELEPIVCPKCHAARLSGSKCYQCGFEYQKRSRLVVQIDGHLKEVEGASFMPRVTRMKPDTEKLWKKMYHRAKSEKWDATFNQARALFFHENHYWPPETLPCMPTEAADWFNKVRQVPTERLQNDSGRIPGSYDNAAANSR